MAAVILIYWPRHPLKCVLFGHSVSTVKKSKDLVDKQRYRAYVHILKFQFRRSLSKFT